MSKVKRARRKSDITWTNICEFTSYWYPFEEKGLIRPTAKQIWKLSSELWHLIMMFDLTEHYMEHMGYPIRDGKR